MNPTRYIYQNKKGLFYIMKTMYGERRYYGTYDNLDDAIRVRDYLESKKWLVIPERIARTTKNTNPDNVRSRVARMFNVPVEDLP